MSHMSLTITLMDILADRLFHIIVMFNILFNIIQNPIDLHVSIGCSCKLVCFMKCIWCFSDVEISFFSHLGRWFSLISEKKKRKRAISDAQIEPIASSISTWNPLASMISAHFRAHHSSSILTTSRVIFQPCNWIQMAETWHMAILKWIFSAHLCD